MSLDTSYIMASGKVVYAAGAPAFTGHGIAATPADTGTGDTLLTLSHPALADKVTSIQVTSLTAANHPVLGTVTLGTTGTIQVLGKANADGAAADTDFYITVIASR